MENKQIWVDVGYEYFALHGVVKIEPIAKEIGKSKSSFYHHFADIELFIELLMQYHLAKAEVIAQKELAVNNIDPELINILVEHKMDLLFNRQLRINEQITLFSETLCKSNLILGVAFKASWTKDVNINLSASQLEGVFDLALKDFYLQINAENINYTWLSSYFISLKNITNKLII